MAEKLTRKIYSPGLFDTAQDIIGALPLKLVADWLGSEQTHEDALRLLDKHKVRGYSVCSDSAGLTKLTQKKGLLEILAIINQPKTIVYGLGKAPLAARAWVFGPPITRRCSILIASMRPRWFQHC